MITISTKDSKIGKVSTVYWPILDGKLSYFLNNSDFTVTESEPSEIQQTLKKQQNDPSRT